MSLSMTDFDFIPVDETAFNVAHVEMPPEDRSPAGFLCGEPSSVRVCGVTGKPAEVFRVFVRLRDDSGREPAAHFMGAHPISSGEFVALSQILLRCGALPGRDVAKGGV